jgi:cell division protein FtsX
VLIVILAMTLMLAAGSFLVNWNINQKIKQAAETIQVREITASMQRRNRQN